MGSEERLTVRTLKETHPKVIEYLEAHGCVIEFLHDHCKITYPPGTKRVENYPRVRFVNYIITLPQGVEVYELGQRSTDLHVVTLPKGIIAHPHEPLFHILVTHPELVGLNQAINSILQQNQLPETAQRILEAVQARVLAKLTL